MGSLDNSFQDLKLSDPVKEYSALHRTRFKCKSIPLLTPSEGRDVSSSHEEEVNSEAMPPSETIVPGQEATVSPAPAIEPTRELPNFTTNNDVDLESGYGSPQLRKRNAEEEALLYNDNGVYNTVTSNASFYQHRRAMDLLSLKSKNPKDSTRAGNNNFIMVLSALYAKMLIVMGLAFPISEVISPEFTSSSYMVFYLYLYGGSILYLTYVFGTLLQSKAQKTARGYWSRMRSRSQINSNGPDPPVMELKTSFNQASPSPGRSRSNTFGEIHKAKASQHGSFYLRIGAVAFGVGSMIYSGLEFGQYFEFEAASKCHDIMLAITPAARMVFTFIQMYFIFLNSKMPVNRHRTISYFGLMHVIATNLCVWLSVIIEETKHEMIHHLVLRAPHGTDGKTVSFASLWLGAVGSRQRLVGNDVLNSTVAAFMERPQYSTTGLPNLFENSTILHRSIRGLKKLQANLTDDDYGDDIGATLIDECRRADVMGQLVQEASPFLFPCAIEYSLICAAILYELWKNTAHAPSVTIETESSFPRRSRHQYSVDCARANKGLFSGLFVLVMTIISLILFFALLKQQEYVRVAVLEVNFSRLVIYTVSIIAAFCATLSIQQLPFDKTRHMELDDILLVLGQVGVLSYNVFTIIAAYNDKNSSYFDSYLILATALGSILQAVMQSLFILDASRRYTVTKEQYKEKPARELVTFLLVTNFAMWAINTMEKSRAESNPMQLDFFGPWSWIVITNISMPLAIFYRFHSTVCLCEIWKRCYKVRPDLYG